MVEGFYPFGYTIKKQGLTAIRRESFCLLATAELAQNWVATQLCQEYGAKLRFSHGNQGKNYIDVHHYGIRINPMCKSDGIKSGGVDKDCLTPDQNLSRTGDERDLVRFASMFN